MKFKHVYYMDLIDDETARMGNLTIRIYKKDEA